MRRSRRIVLVGVACGLLAFACNPTAPSSTEPAPATPTPSATETPSSTLEPTTVPEPSPSSTILPLQLEVIEWHRWDEPVVEAWDVDRGWGYVYARLRNPHDFPVEAAGTPTFQLLDGTGQPVYRSLGVDLYDGSPLGIGQIPPGETVGMYFCACGTVGTVVIPEWTAFELDLDLRQTEPVAVSTEFLLTPSRVFQNEVPMEGRFAVAFTGRYTGSRPLKAIAVRMTLRDGQGNYLGSGEVGILGDRIPGGFAEIRPGDAFDQTVSTLLDPAFKDEHLDYELQAIGSLAGP